MSDSLLACVVLYTCPIVVTAFLEREIFTHLIRLFIFVGRLGVWGFVMFGAPFSERGILVIFTHLLRLFIYVRLISLPACFVMVLVCDRASLTFILLILRVFLERGIFTRLLNFACLFVLDSSLACVVLHTCPIVVTAFFRTRNIHTPSSPVYLC